MLRGRNDQQTSKIVAPYPYGIKKADRIRDCQSGRMSDSTGSRNHGAVDRWYGSFNR